MFWTSHSYEIYDRLGVINWTNRQEIILSGKFGLQRDAVQDPLKVEQLEPVDNGGQVFHRQAVSETNEWQIWYTNRFLNGYFFRFKSKLVVWT
jgi:hypothetical protein